MNAGQMNSDKSWDRKYRDSQNQQPSVTVTPSTPANSQEMTMKTAKGMKIVGIIDRRIKKSRLGG
jgi:hypothetical protein